MTMNKPRNKEPLSAYCPKWCSIAILSTREDPPYTPQTVHYQQVPADMCACLMRLTYRGQLLTYNQVMPRWVGGGQSGTSKSKSFLHISFITFSHKITSIQTINIKYLIIIKSNYYLWNLNHKNLKILQIFKILF